MDKTDSQLSGHDREGLNERIASANWEKTRNAAFLAMSELGAILMILALMFLSMSNSVRIVLFVLIIAANMLGFRFLMALIHQSSVESVLRERKSHLELSQIKSRLNTL